MPRFRSPLIRRSRGPRSGLRGRLVSWWILWRVPALVAIVAGLWWYGVRPIAYEQGWVPVTGRFAECGSGRGAEGCVVDGDTVIIGFGAERRRIRLTGFDAPEIEGTCPAESRLAITARTALTAWLAQGVFEWNGSDDPPRDQYGRELREVRRVAGDGTREYLAETMITRGLARESGWGAEPVEWCE
ncbi:MAG: hypothetical protein WBA51_03460 [Erythrobacter sp.]